MWSAFLSVISAMAVAFAQSFARSLADGLNRKALEQGRIDAALAVQAQESEATARDVEREMGQIAAGRETIDDVIAALDEGRF